MLTPQYFVNSTPLEPPSTATAMYGSTMRAAIAALAVGTLGMFGLAVLAEAFARRRTARPTTVAGPVVSDAASLGTEGGASNGSRRASWSGSLPALRLAQTEPSKQETAQQESSQQESSQQESMCGSHRCRNRRGGRRTGSHRSRRRRRRSHRVRSRGGGGRPRGSHRGRSRGGGRRGRNHRTRSRRGRRHFSSCHRSRTSSAHKPSIEHPANNGHKRPTTDRSP